MSNYLETIRQELLVELENKEITEEEFWEYYNQECGNYDESQSSSWYSRSDYERF